MKHKTATLEGALLDAAVAKALGWKVTRDPEEQGGGLDALDVQAQRGHILSDESSGWSPSRQWEDGGPIIERERIDLLWLDAARGWSANFEIHVGQGEEEHRHTGPTPLIAAMRAYVASRFGDEVELP